MQSNIHMLAAANSAPTNPGCSPTTRPVDGWAPLLLVVHLFLATTVTLYSPVPGECVMDSVRRRRAAGHAGGSGVASYNRC